MRVHLLKKFLRVTLDQEKKSEKQISFHPEKIKILFAQILIDQGG